MQRDFKISLSQEYYSDTVYLSQYDSDYDIVFNVMDKYASATSIDGMSAKFMGTRSDSLGFQYTTTASGSTATFTIDTALTALSGTCTAEVVFYDENGLYFGSANVQVVIEPATHTDDTVDADVTAQQTLLEEIQEAVDNAAASVASTVGDLSDLTTTDQSSVVAAINEVDADVSQLNAEITAIPSIKDSDAESGILDFTDTSGNVALRLQDGNIQTKEFNSNRGTYTKSIAYSDTSGTATINHPFVKGDKVICKMSVNDAERRATGNIASYTITYTCTDAGGNTYTLGSDYGYNHPMYEIPEDVVSITASYGSGLIWHETGTLVFKVYAVGDIERKPNIIHVASDGSGDYTSLRSAVDSITDNDEINQYIVYLHEGTYNIIADYTADEISASGFKGLFIGNGISLVGVGSRDAIIIHGELDTSDYDLSKRNDVSTLNLAGDCRLENITVTASNIRYAVHDDTASMAKCYNTRTLRGCRFYGENLTSGGGGNISYGAGGGNRKVIDAKNCDFSDIVGIHSSANNTYGFRIFLENCVARRFSFSDYNSVVASKVYLINCKVGIIVETISGTHDQCMFIEGTTNEDVIIKTLSGYVYNINGCHRFENVAVSSGHAVAIGTAFHVVSATSDVDKVYGISVGTVDGDTIVQTQGYINSNVLGLSGLVVGDYLTIDSTGAVVSGGTADNAVAVVKFVDSDSVAYAKLMI